MITKYIRQREKQKEEAKKLEEKQKSLHIAGSRCENCAELKTCGMATEFGVEIKEDCCTDWNPIIEE